MIVDNLYKKIIKAGTYIASSIKVAEAAKVIENTQRDVNIALVNELALIFDTMEISSQEVLEAAGTKWNFLPFKPGLVGGHCIGVDPYYLTFKAQQVGHHPEIILAGRRINDKMSEYAASKFFKAMSKLGMAIQGAKILVLGFSFKENCPDIRNTKVINLIHELEEYGALVDVVDPWVDAYQATNLYDIRVLPDVSKSDYDGAILAVAHDLFIETGAKKIRSYCGTDHILFDLKACLPQAETDLRL